MKVDLKHHSSSTFGASDGILGNYTTGEMMSRTGAILEDPDQFGLEWQVLSSEPMLFHDIQGPQHPTKCKIPTSSTMQGRRRLVKQRTSRLAAQQACAGVEDPGSKADCVFDVMASDGVEMAGTDYEF